MQEQHQKILLQQHQEAARQQQEQQQKQLFMQNQQRIQQLQQHQQQAAHQAAEQAAQQSAEQSARQQAHVQHAFQQAGQQAAQEAARQASYQAMLEQQKSQALSQFNSFPLDHSLLQNPAPGGFSFENAQGIEDFQASSRDCSFKSTLPQANVTMPKSFELSSFQGASLMGLTTPKDPDTTSVATKQPSPTVGFPQMQQDQESIFPKSRQPDGPIFVPNLDVLNQAIDQRITGIAQSFKKGFMIPGQNVQDSHNPSGRSSRTSLSLTEEAHSGQGARSSISLMPTNPGQIPNDSQQTSRASTITNIENVSGDAAGDALLENMGM